MKIASKDRVAYGLCPNCGKEAAPYRLCHECRMGRRLARCVKRGSRLGALQQEGEGRDAKYSINKNRTEDSHRQWGKWSTKVILPDTDRRGKPRVHGVRINFEATLLRVIEFIGRPCTIDEILAAWGKLRAKRSDPLPFDIGRILVAEDRRKTRAEKRARLAR